MKIQKHIEKQILRNYFFIEGIIDINAKYFIDQINKGVQKEDNLTRVTYVRDQMTAWNYFNGDMNFINFLHKAMDYVDKSLPISAYELTDAWGYRINFGGETREHAHLPNIWSGVLYLNDHKQTLEFPEINQTIIPKKGKFVLFSSHLRHKSVKHREKNPKYGISFNFKQQNNF